MPIRCKLFGCDHSEGYHLDPLGVYRYRYPARYLQFLFAAEFSCKRCKHTTVKLSWLNDEISLRNRFSLESLSGKDVI
ncbi:hypothetical protein CN281_27095 [Bacillus cereus]|nr:hypothetical protein CN281_27095 [Bacillus cereus]